MHFDSTSNAVRQLAVINNITTPLTLIFHKVEAFKDRNILKHDL